MSMKSINDIENLLQMSKMEMSAKKVSKVAKTRVRKYLMGIKKLCDVARKDLLVKDPVVKAAEVEATPIEVAET